MVIYRLIFFFKIILIFIVEVGLCETFSAEDEFNKSKFFCRTCQERFLIGSAICSSHGEQFVTTTSLLFYKTGGELCKDYLDRVPTETNKYSWTKVSLNNKKCIH